MPEEALYALKLKRDRPSASGLAWRVTLEDLREPRRWNFASLEAFFAFLAERYALSGSEGLGSRE